MVGAGALASEEKLGELGLFRLEKGHLWGQITAAS